MKRTHKTLCISENAKAKKETQTTEIISININNVSFQYEEDTVTDVSIDLAIGNMYGITGGEKGKKWLFDLLCGIIQPLHGEVLINEAFSLQDVHDWMSHIALVRDPKAVKSSENDFTPDSLLDAAPIILVDGAFHTLSPEEEEEFLLELSLKNESSIILLNTDRPFSLKYCQHVLLMKNLKLQEVGKHIYLDDCGI